MKIHKKRIYFGFLTNFLREVLNCDSWRRVFFVKRYSLGTFYWTNGKICEKIMFYYIHKDIRLNNILKITSPATTYNCVFNAISPTCAYPQNWLHESQSAIGTIPLYFSLCDPILSVFAASKLHCVTNSLSLSLCFEKKKCITKTLTACYFAFSFRSFSIWWDECMENVPALLTLLSYGYVLSVYVCMYFLLSLSLSLKCLSRKQCNLFPYCRPCVLRCA